MEEDVEKDVDEGIEHNDGADQATRRNTTIAAYIYYVYVAVCQD